VLRIIAEAADGLTRRINIYADKTLLAAFAAGTHSVTPDHARAAITDTQIVVTRRESPRRLAAVASVGVAVGVALGFVLAQFVGTRSTSPVLAAAPASAATSAPGARPESQPIPSQPAAIPVRSTAAAPPADPVAARLAAGRDLIAEKAPPGYAVQLMVSDARSRGYVESYLAEAAKLVDPERLYLVPAGSVETPRLGVLIGGFRERGEALAALDALPEPLKQFRPYVRPIDAVRDDARRAENR
jgi:septal ring-binding cell division protein DamX